MKIKDGFAVRTVLGEQMLMPIDHYSRGKEIYSLNEVAAFILSQMEKPISKEKILERLLKEYAVDGKTAETAVDALIAQFSSIGTIVNLEENITGEAESPQKNTRLARKPGLFSADMNGSAVMMDTDNGKYYNLGEVGSVIWSMLEEPMTVDEILAGLMEAFEIDRETCEKDTLPFLQSLVEKGLLIRM